MFEVGRNHLCAVPTPAKSRAAWLFIVDVVNVDVEVVDEAVDESETDCWSLMAA